MSNTIESYTTSRRRRSTAVGAQQQQPVPSVGVSSTGNVWVDPTAAVAESVDLTFRLAPPYAQIVAPPTPAAGVLPSTHRAGQPAAAAAAATTSSDQAAGTRSSNDGMQQRQTAVLDVANAHHLHPTGVRSASATATRRVFIEQQGGTFLHAAADRAARRQRSEQAHQELWVAQNANAQGGAFGHGWTNSDDARLFAHFLARVVVRLNHFKRTIVALAAGVSLCLLLVLFKINANAEAFTATPISNSGGAVVANATAIVGAYGAHCDPTVQAEGDCTTLLLLASIYKWSSYFHHAVTMVGCVLALLAFAADCALASSSRVAVFSNAAGGGLPKPAASPLSLRGGSATSTEGDGSAGGTSSQLQQHRPTRQYTALWRLIGRHLVASSFPLLVIALCATLACESVELGRRSPREIVALPQGLAQRQIVATVLRAACLIAAWVVGVVFHSFSDQTILDEIVHHDSVESLSVSAH